MSVYTIVLFVHVVGAIGYFLGIASWLLILVGLHRAQHVAEVRNLIRLNNLSAALSGAGAAVLLIAGLYLALSAWSLLTGWILVALISLVLIVPITAMLVAPRRSALVVQLEREAPEGAPSEALKQRIRDPILSATLQTVAFLLLGIVFLMTTKPELIGSLVVMAIALALGLLSSLLVSRMRQAPRQEIVAQGAEKS